MPTINNITFSIVWSYEWLCWFQKRHLKFVLPLCVTCFWCGIMYWVYSSIYLSKMTIWSKNRQTKKTFCYSFNSTGHLFLLRKKNYQFSLWNWKHWTPLYWVIHHLFVFFCKFVRKFSVNYMLKFVLFPLSYRI